MTDQELLDRVGRMNRFPANQPLPEWIADLPIPDTHGRDDMSTTKQRPKRAEITRERSWRGAMAAVVALVIAVVAVTQLQRDDAVGGPGSWPEVVNPAPPADIVAAAEAGDELAILWVWYDAVGSGDVATARRYMAEGSEPNRIPFDHQLAVIEFNAAHTGGVGSLNVESCTPPQATSEITCEVRVLDAIVAVTATSSASATDVVDLTGLVMEGLVVLVNERAQTTPPWAAYAWVLDQLDPGGREAACVPGPTALDFEGIVFDKACGDYIWETLHAAGSDRAAELATQWANEFGTG